MLDPQSEQRKQNSRLMVVIGVILLVVAPLIMIPNILMNLMGGEESFFSIIIGSVFIFAGTMLIIYSKEYKNRFGLASLTLFIQSSLFFLIYITFIPRMKQMAEDFKETEESDIASGALFSSFEPNDVDFVFYENLLLSLIVLFLIAAIVLLIIHFAVRSSIRDSDIDDIIVEIRS
jgi:hypothetical protein